jgi:ribosomal protein S18 acetylase RimI-like enzyme
VTDLTERLQTYLRTQLREQEVVEAGLFSVYFATRAGSEKESLAIPLERTTPADGAPLTKMEQLFAARNLSPRVTFLDAYNPSLAALLGQNGYALVKEELVLVCTPDTLRPAPEMPGLTTLVLSSDSSLEDVQEGLQQTGQLGFDPFATRTWDTDAELFRKTLVTGRAFVLRLNKKPVTAGMFCEIVDGMTQVTGITTLKGFRRRGFAAYLTGYMTKYAFARQVDTVFITTPADGTDNVYRRVGFKPCATLLTFEKGLGV